MRWVRGLVGVGWGTLGWTVVSLRQGMNVVEKYKKAADGLRLGRDRARDCCPLRVIRRNQKKGDGETCRTYEVTLH